MELFQTKIFCSTSSYHNGLNTWKKLFVLTEDNELYCEYLEYGKPTTVRENFDYSSFKPSDYSWGKGKFQHLREIDHETARNEGLTRQANWIDAYLKSKGVI